MYVSQIHNLNLVNLLFMKFLLVTQKEVCFKLLYYYNYVSLAFRESDCQ